MFAVKVYPNVVVSDGANCCSTFARSPSTFPADESPPIFTIVEIAFSTRSPLPSGNGRYLREADLRHETENFRFGSGPIGD
jgi:hypothetical protein